MWKEFKEFAFKGNVLDLAVAVIMGAAFGKIVSSIVDNLLMPIVGVILGGKNFSNLAITVGEAKIGYGMVIQNVIDFFIVAFFIFLMIKAAKKIQKPVEEEEAGPTTEELLTEIRDMMKEQSK